MEGGRGYGAAPQRSVAGSPRRIVGIGRVRSGRPERARRGFAIVGMPERDLGLEPAECGAEATSLLGRLAVGVGACLALFRGGGGGGKVVDGGRGGRLGAGLGADGAEALLQAAAECLGMGLGRVDVGRLGRAGGGGDGLGGHGVRIRICLRVGQESGVVGQDGGGHELWGGGADRARAGDRAGGTNRRGRQRWPTGEL
jgi:hypothetical protein